MKFFKFRTKPEKRLKHIEDLIQEYSVVLLNYEMAAAAIKSKLKVLEVAKQELRLKNTDMKPESSCENDVVVLSADLVEQVERS